MNFRTTLVLLLLVVVVGIVVFFTQQHGANPSAQQAASGPEHKLTDIDAKDITRVAVTNVDGKKTVLEKTGSDWKLLEPVKADAKNWEVETLINDIANLQTRGQVDESQRAAGGLDHPSFTVEVTTRDGKTTKLLVGDKPQLSDTLLVQLGDNKKPNVVGSALYTSLDKPASTYRKSNLTDVQQDQIKQLAITRGKNTIKLEKKGTEWEVTEPKQMPADSSAVSDLLFAVTGLNAGDFVTDDASKAGDYGLAHPRLTVWYSTQPAGAGATTQPAASKATTQPAATQPAGVTIRFGDYEDLLKRNVFAEVDHGPIAKVPVSSETSFDKKPLDLRNKDVLNIDPSQVKRFTIATHRAAATQPTTRSAENNEFAVERRKEEPAILGPAMPAGAAAATQPATQPAAVAATQPTTQPAVASATTKPAATQPASKWFFASGKEGDADEGQVTAFLAALHPLKVDKYLESAPAPTTQPSSQYVVTVQTNDGKEHTLRFDDPGAAGRVIGQYQDLTFEVDRTFLEKLTGDFKTRKPEPTTPSMGAPGGGLPFGGVH